MRRINYFAAILVAPTLLYAALVILNPFNYFGKEEGDRLFAIAYIVAPYPGKAAAIQLVGTTLIAFGIIVSQEKLTARIASLTGTSFVWVGLMQGIADNPLLAGATLVIFVGSILSQGVGISAYMLGTTIIRLAPPVIAWLIQYASIMRQRAVHPIRSTGNRISKWIVWVRRTARRLWPF